MPVKLFASLLFILLLACSGPSSDTPPARQETVRLGLSILFDSSLNNAEKQMVRDKDSLTLSALKETDFFIEPGGAYEKSNAPLLLKKVDNTRPFTFTAELKPEHLVKYDAGMLLSL
jgi:hypothetical protein